MLHVRALTHWVAHQEGVTLATWALVLATFVLGVATFLLYLDGKRQGEQQLERWRREDRAELPHAVVEVSPKYNPFGIVITCVNLGRSAFVIHQHVLRGMKGRRSSGKTPGPPVVLPGSGCHVQVDMVDLLSPNETENFEIVLQLRTFERTVDTDPVQFYVVSKEKDFYLGLDFWGNRLPGEIVEQPREIKFNA